MIESMHLIELFIISQPEIITSTSANADTEWPTSVGLWERGAKEGSAQVNALTDAPAAINAAEKQKGSDFSEPFPEILSWRRPTFPRSYPRSIIGPARLNFRVRDGNGCDPCG